MIYRSEVLSDPHEGTNADVDAPKYRLRLYIAGNSPRSLRAVKMLRRLAETRLQDDVVDLEIIDIYQETDRARQDQVIGVPTLIRELPVPLRRLLGDLSDERRVLLALDLDVEEDDDDEPEA